MTTGETELTPTPSDPIAPQWPDFSDDAPTTPVTDDQRKYCVEALRLLNERLQNSDEIDQEFNQLEAKPESVWAESRKVALNSNNVSKNRHPFAVPYDKTRVVLDSSEEGYINASFPITLSEEVPQFIATQHPLQHTMEDFWQMILQHRCPAILMLTRSLDQFRDLGKGGDYFQADNGPREFGNITVVRKERLTTDCLQLCKLEVNHKEAC